MNHSINLLQPSEVHYLSAAASNPVYKWAGVGILAAGAVSAGLYFMNLKKDASRYETMASRWETIREDVQAARELNGRKNRLDLGTQTLKGWSASRVNWDAMLVYLVEQAPGAREDIQFTRLQWNEIMEGLRDQSPGTEKADFHPLTRIIDLNLRGILRSSRPERLLTQFQQNLSNGNSPVNIEAVTLDNYVQLKDEQGNNTDRTAFAFTIRLAPREVLP